MFASCLAQFNNSLTHNKSPQQSLARALFNNLPVNSPDKASSSAQEFLRRHRLALGLLLLVVFKLWLVHTEEIYGSATEYDALWYVGAAKHWYWGAPYSWTAFVRPPAYPLFIALVHSVGFPLRIAIELLQIAAYLVLITAFRKVAVPRAICLLAFAVMVLHPATWWLNNYTMSDNFYSAMLPLAVGGLLLTLFTRKYGHALWTGAALAVLWNTREESILIPPMLAVFFAIGLIRQRSETGSWKASIASWSKPAGLLLGILALLVLAVNAANYRAFQSFTKSEFNSPPFKAVFKALLRIKPSRIQRYIAVPSESLQKAFEVSPTFAQLKPQFEGELGYNWQNPARDTLGVSEYGPWFMWALRNVAAKTGFHTDPATANRFYSTAAAEINRACDEGRLPSRFVLSSFLDPGALTFLDSMPESYGKTVALFFVPRIRIIAHEDTNLTPPQRALYDEMTGRRLVPLKLRGPNRVNPISRLSAKLQNIIGSNYRFLLAGLVVAGVAAILILLLYFRELRLTEPVNPVLLLLAATIFLRVTFFAFLDATWWMAGYDRYLVPVMPLTSCFFILLIYRAIAVWRNRNEFSSPAFTQC